MAAWLMKSEPDVFSIDDLKARPRKTDMWDGVRNYQARNWMRDTMARGNLVFFYHSNCAEPGIYGLATISSRRAYPDPTQFDPASHYYDPTSPPDDPRWVVVDVTYSRHLRRPLTLAELREHAAALDGLALLRTGNRLSVMPVSDEHAAYLLDLEAAAPPS
jgi:predicted RNA-binding protein with PUA-like domain